jgi:DNA polymerase IV
MSDDEFFGAVPPIDMTDNELSAKEAYFEEQSLLELADDERDFHSDRVDMLDRALADSKAMPPPSLKRTSSSFLGPTPKERQSAFEAHLTKHRAGMRESGNKLARSSTAPETELTTSFSVTKSRGDQMSNGRSANKPKRVASLPDMETSNQTPFYKQMGFTIPRELKNGKNVKLADNIKLEPEQKQLLRNKIVYFHPNDDISMARRMRLHKVIQLGAAWVNRWRDDVTHIMFDDASYSYSQLLRHLNKAGFSVGISQFYPFHSLLLIRKVLSWSSSIRTCLNASSSVHFLILPHNASPSKVRPQGASQSA